jgi:hypothetical protein
MTWPHHHRSTDGQAAPGWLDNADHHDRRALGPAGADCHTRQEVAEVAARPADHQPADTVTEPIPPRWMRACWPL